MFRKIVLFFAFILAINCLICAQPGTDKGKVIDQNSYARQVKWERYKVSQSQVSVLFPKQPILIPTSDICREQETNTYAAYAEEVVYTMRVTSKMKGRPGFSCLNKKDFDEKNFEDRLTELRVSKEEIEESKYSQNDREVVKIKNGITTYWLFNDYQNKRWFELWVSHKSYLNPDVKNFAQSIEIIKNPPGIEIGKGAEQIYGDYSEQPAKISIKIENQSGAGKELSGGLGQLPTDGFGEKDKADAPKEDAQTKEDSVQKENARTVIVHKERARYTDAARENNIRGTVTLKVTFLANGGIGSISPVSGLPFGLTEQAIAAAKKIVFLPGRKEGVTFTTSRVVAYSFSIY